MQNEETPTEVNPYLEIVDRMSKPALTPLDMPVEPAPERIPSFASLSNPYIAMQESLAVPAQPRLPSSDKLFNETAIGSLSSVMGINPDQAAEATKLGTPLGIGQDLALYNMDEVRQRSVIAMVQRTGMLQNNPRLAQSLLDPVFAAQAHDDLDSLAKTSSLFEKAVNFIGPELFDRRPGQALRIAKVLEEGYAIGELGAELGQLKSRRAMTLAFGSEDEYYDLVNERIAYLEKQMGGKQPSGIFGTTAQVVAQGIVNAKPILTGAMLGAATGGVVHPWWGAVGFKLGAGYGIGLTTAEIEGGVLYDDMVATGVDPETALFAAAAGGTVIGTIEAASDAVTLLPGWAGVKRLVTKEISEQLTKPTIRAAVAQAGKNVVLGTFGQGAEEGLQSGFGLGFTRLAQAIDGIESDITAEQVAKEIADSFIAGVQGGILLSSVGPSLSLMVDVQRADAVAKQQEFFDGLEAAKRNSKLAKRNLDAWESFVARQAKGTTADTVYVEANAAAQVLAQSGVSVTELEKVIPGIREQLKNALENGGDVTIPTSVYSARLVGTPLGDALRQHVRISPDAKSVVQAQEINRKRDALLQEAQAALAERQEADAAFVESAQKVETTVAEQLRQTGMQDIEVRANAELFRDLAVTQAARMGITPEQFYERYPYRVRGPQVVQEGQPLEQADQFDQAGQRRTDTPQFRAWSNNAQLVTKDQSESHQFATGVPVVVEALHGSIQKGLRKFDVNAAVEVEGAIFFSSNEEVASQYTFERAYGDIISDEPLGEVISAYVSFQNPMVYAPKGRVVDAIEMSRVITQAKELGHDGVIIQNIDDSIGMTGDMGNVYVTWNPTSIKSTDNSGAFSRATADIYNQASRIDADYMAAVERGDMETAQRMVDEAARASGYTIPVYHFTRSDEPFTSFDLERMQSGPGIWLTSSPEGWYGRRMDLYLNPGKIKNVKSQFDRTWREGELSIEGILEGDLETISQQNINTLRNTKDYDSTFYVATRPEQVKLADPVVYDESGNVVPLSRRFDITSPKVFEQAATEPRLMAVHNLSADNLQFAARMGGLAVPSIGVITEEAGGVEGFGELTLIGTREMAEPRTTPVFEADAYSARFPRPEWPGVSTAKADAVVASIRDLQTEFGDVGLVDSTFNFLVNEPDANKLAERWLRSPAIMAMYLRERGIEIAPILETRPTLSRLTWEAIDRLTPIYLAVDQQQAYDVMEESPEYAALKVAYADEVRRQYEGVAEELPEGRVDEWARQFTPTTLQRLSRDVQETNRQRVAREATSDAITGKLEPLYAEYKTWVDQKTREQFGAPFLRDGKLKRPYTLGNIVDFMASAKVKGEEKGLTFGAGAARAKRARAFPDLEEMREAAKTAIVNPEEYSQARKESEKTLEAYRLAVVDYTRLTDWRGKQDTWAAMDAAMKALARYGKRKKRNVKAMREALSRERFAIGSMPTEIIEQAIDAADALFSAPVPYFEAKPQRAVRLDEFAGAVIPTNASQETRDILQRNGIPYISYLSGDEADRQRAVRQMAVSPEARGEVLFQTARAPRGDFDPAKLMTTLREGRDFSTFLHETAHFYLTILADIARSATGPQQSKADMDALLRWFGIEGVTPAERLAKWSSMTIDQQRQYHEQFAYSVEIYVHEGKAPSVELQSLFNQFAAWLKRVYKSIRDELNATYKAQFGRDLPMMNSEIRLVMDRMLATDEQIARAQAVRGMKAMFQTQEQSGMNDAEWAAYQALEQDATDAATAELTKATLKELQWYGNAQSKYLREIQAKHDRARKEIREEVSAQVQLEPVYRAMEFLKKGTIRTDTGEVTAATGAYKLDLAKVRAIMPAGFDPATLKYGKYGMVQEGGIDPDMAAGMFGYGSGVELINAILGAKPIKEEIDARTDQRMLDENSDLATPEARQAAVDMAIHNEARARFIAVEQRWLEKQRRPANDMLQAARQVAQDIIGDVVIRTLNPRRYEAAEAEAARTATTAYREPQDRVTAGRAAETRAYNEAIAAGQTPFEATVTSTQAGVEASVKATERLEEFRAKYGGREPAEVARRAKRQQLVQNQLAREAMLAKEEIAVAGRDFRKFFRSDEKLAKTRDMAPIMAARAILSYYGYGKRGESPAQYLDQLRTYAPELYDGIAPIVLKSLSGTTDYRDLTVTEFRVLRDTVQALWAQARRDRQITVEGERVALDVVLKEMADRLQAIGVGERVGQRQAPGAVDQANRHLLGLRAMMSRVEAWADALDGMAGPGAFTKYLFRPVKQAVDAYRIERNKYVERFVKLLDGIDLPVGKIAAPELDYTFGNGNGGIGRAELLGALMHTGNEGNYRKLLLGRGWGELDADGNLDDSRWRSFVARMISEGKLTKADYDFVQSIWDLLEEIKPLAQRAHFDMYGYYFKEVEATEVVTPFGTYRGGYVPAATDKFMVQDARVNASMDELEGDWRNSLPSTGAGFTKGRVDYNEALSLDLRLIATHTDAVLRFSMIQPSVKDALKILRDRDLKALLERFDPAVMENMLLPWLNRAARQQATEPGRWKLADKFWGSVRSRAGVATMFANLRNALQQVTGWFPSLLKVKRRYLQSALMTYLGSPKQTAEAVARLSPFMADRMRNQMFELQGTMNELLLNPSKYEKLQQWSSKHGYFLQQAFQNMVDVTTWQGAYNQALAEGETQAEAVARADAAVRLTQGSLSPEDKSMFEVGTPFYNTFVQFTGYFNMLANLNLGEYQKTVRDMGWRSGKGRLLYIYVMGMLLPAIVSDAIVRSLGGGWDDEDEDGYMDVFMDWFFGSQVRMGAALLPFGSTAYTAITTAFNDKPYDDRITTSPSIAALESATIGTSKAIIAVTDEDKDVTGRNVRDVLTLITLLTGVPVSALGRPAGYLVDVERGEIEPESGYDMIRGMITGTATPESKR
jgi:hypothetical protein